jgi:hypothetical protein
MTYLTRIEAADVPDEVIYRCIHAACARPLPRRVNFCPYCGTGQHAGVMKPAHVVKPAEVPYVAPPVLEKAVAPPPPEKVEPAAAQPPPRAAAQARPPGPRPVRLRYWVLALTVLWAIWIWAKPTTKKIDAKIEQAIALADECKSKEAQSELIALRRTRATPEQLQRLQQSINASAVACERKRARTKAWNDAIVAVNNAMAASEWDKALSRLNLFTRRWGEDGETREFRTRIAAERAAGQKAQADKPSCLLEGRDWVDGRCT